MDTCLVTGATGFVGANLVRRLLDKNFRVKVLVRPQSNRKNLEGLDLEVVTGDLGNREAIEAGCRGTRFVFHCAADYRIWAPDPKDMYASNIDGTVNVLEAAWKAGAEKIVHCSSVAAVKPPEERTPSDESSKYASVDEPVSPYKKSKYISEITALDFAKRGAPVVVVNPAAPIGPHDIKPTPTGRIVVDFLNGRIPSYIDTGLNVVHVGDVAEGHYLAAVKGRVGERYILGGENMTLKALLDALAQISGKTAPRFKTPYALAYLFSALDTARGRLFGAEPFAPLDAVRMARHYMWFDSSKAKRELGYATRPARQALAEAVAWFQENGYTPTPRERIAACTPS